MRSKNEVDCSFIKLVTLFYRWIQYDKTRNFVYGEAFKIQNEIYRFRHGVLKTHTIYYECLISIKFPQGVIKDLFLTIV